MEWMDRARLMGGLVWVAAGLLFEMGAWVRGVSPGMLTWLLIGDIALLGILLLARPASAAAWLLGWLTAVLLAADLVGAVADRFGLLGEPRAPGVSWGGWQPFVAYVSVLLHHPGRSIVLTAGVAATMLEALLAGMLFSGWQRRWVGKALAGLLLTYMVAMASSVGLGEVATYGVPVLVGGALLVSASPARRRTTADPLRPHAVSATRSRAAGSLGHEVP